MVYVNKGAALGVRMLSYIESASGSAVLCAGRVVQQRSAWSLAAWSEAFWAVIAAITYL